MATTYAYSIATDFGGTTPQAHVLHESVTASPSITVACDGVNVDEAKDLVEFVMVSALADPAETDALDALVAAYVPRVYNTTKYFDAVVDSKFKGQYTSIAAAFAAGHTSVYVRDGTYVEVADINMPNSGQLVGESQGNVRVILAAGNSCVLDGSNKLEHKQGTVSVTLGTTTVTGVGTQFTAFVAGDLIQLEGEDKDWLRVASIASDTSLELAANWAGAADVVAGPYTMHNIRTDGTISVTHGSATVTGVGTSFTQGSRPMQPGYFVLLGTNYHQIAAVVSDTELTLAVPYLGATLGSKHYVGQSMFSGCRVANIVFAMSSGPGLHVRGCRNSGFEGVAVIGNTPNVLVEETGDTSFYTFISPDSQGDGIHLRSCYSVLFDTCDVYNAVGHGIRMTGRNASNILDTVSVSNNAGNGLSLEGMALDLHVSDSVLKQNNGHGISASALCDHLLFQGCSMVENAGKGGELLGDHTVASSCMVVQNGGDGLTVGSHAVVDGNQVVGNGGHGLVVTGIKGEVDGGRFQNNGGHGVWCTGSHSGITAGHTCDNTGDGILVEADDCQVEVDMCTDNTGTGVKVVGHRCQVETDKIHDNGAGGVVVTGDSCAVEVGVVDGDTGVGLTVTGDDCTVEGGVIQGSTSHGVVLTGNDCILSTLRIKGNAGDGLRIESGSTDCMLVGCNFKGNTGTNLVDSGTTTTLSAVLQ